MYITTLTSGNIHGYVFCKTIFFCVFAYRDDISKMSYLTCVFKEVMRHYTTAPIVARMIDQPCIIDGVEFPKGSFFDLNIYSVHHNPEVWDDPWVCAKITICLMYLCCKICVCKTLFGKRLFFIINLETILVKVLCFYLNNLQ